jgi:hypothetical protein
MMWQVQVMVRDAGDEPRSRQWNGRELKGPRVGARVLHVAPRSGKICARRKLLPASSTGGDAGDRAASCSAGGAAGARAPAMRQAAGRCARKIDVTFTARSGSGRVGPPACRRISRRTRANVLRMSVLALGV